MTIGSSVPFLVIIESLLIGSVAVRIVETLRYLIWIDFLATMVAEFYNCFVSLQGREFSTHFVQVDVRRDCLAQLEGRENHLFLLVGVLHRPRRLQNLICLTESTNKRSQLLVFSI